MADPDLWIGAAGGFGLSRAPRQIIQQMDCGPRHRSQRREELTGCREMLLRERVSGEDDIVWSCTMGRCRLALRGAHVDFGLPLVQTRTEAISLLDRI
jgi:hypothetical protein